jgi:hypothetical protein
VAITYNPFKKYAGQTQDSERELANYQTRFDALGIPQEEDPSVWDRVTSGAKTALGYGMKGLDYMYRPFNTVFNASQYISEPGRATGSEVLRHMGKGWRGEEYSGMSDTVANLLPGSRVPFKEMPMFFTDTANKLRGRDDLVSPENAAKWKQYLEGNVDGEWKKGLDKPTGSGIVDSMATLASNASPSDILGLALDFKTNSLFPRLAPIVDQYKGVQPGSAKAYKLKRVQGSVNEMERMHDAIKPDIDQALKRMQGSRYTPTLDEATDGIMTPEYREAIRNKIPTRKVRESIEKPPMVSDEDMFFGGFMNDVPDAPPEHVIPVHLRNTFRKMKERGMGVVDYREGQPGETLLIFQGAGTPQQLKTIGKSGQVTRIGKTKEGYSFVGIKNDQDVTKAIDAMPDYRDEQGLLPEDWWEDFEYSDRSKQFQTAYKGKQFRKSTIETVTRDTGRTAIKPPVQRTTAQYMGKTVNVQNLYEDFNGRVLAEIVDPQGNRVTVPAEQLTNTLKTKEGMYRMKPEGIKPDPTVNIFKTGKRAAKSKGYDMDAVIRKAMDPKFSDLEDIVKQLRNAGRVDPQLQYSAGRGLPLVDKAKHGGFEVKVGDTTVVGRDKVNPFLSGLKKGVYENTPGVSNAIQLLGPMFSRRFVKKGAPEKVTRIADILDSTQAEAHGGVMDLSRKAGVAFQGLNDDELKFITHMVEDGGQLDLTDINQVTNFISQLKLGVNPVKVFNESDRFRNAALATKEFMDEFAQTEQKLGIMEPIRQAYMPHMYEMSPEYQQALKAGNILARRFSTKHGFAKKRTGPSTLKRARELNLEAKKQGLPEPFIIKEERADRLLGLRASAHYRTKSNAEALKRIENLGTDLVSPNFKAGFEPSSVFKGQFAHPEVERILKEAVGEYGASGSSLQKFFQALQKIHLPWKALVTRVVPAFHIRNEMDNMLKLYLSRTDMGYIPKAKSILSGADGSITTKAGDVSYQQIREWVENKGLRGTGQFGMFGDIPGNIADVAMRTSEGPLKFFVRHLNPLEVGQKVGDYLETHAKLTKFLDELVKYGDPDWAAKQANKLLFNYADITPVERDFMRTVYPFWTFHRKNIPLMYEMMMSNPDKFMKMQSVKRSIESKFPLAEEQEYTPEYMKGTFTVRMPGEGSRNDTVQYLSPNFSTTSLQTPFKLNEEGLKNLAPLFKLMVELTMNKKTFNLKDISKQGESTTEIPQVFAALPDFAQKQFGIHWGKDPDTGEKKLFAPSSFYHVIDTLQGGAIRDVGNIFKAEPGREKDNRNPFLKAFVKEIDPAQVKYFNTKDETERLKARVQRFRSEGVDVPTMEEMGVQRNPFKKVKVPK